MVALSTDFSKEVGLMLVFDCPVVEIDSPIVIEPSCVQLRLIPAVT